MGSNGVWTGTGQLCGFLSFRTKCRYGIDFSDGSLDKARKLKQKLQLDSWHLKKVYILDIKQIEDVGMKFDYVLCLGVLHHTGNAYLGFKNMLNLLNERGNIAIGLYNRSGRILLNIRKFLARTIFKNNDKVKDYFIRM